MARSARRHEATPPSALAPAPFLKWLGGKRQLAPRLLELFAQQPFDHYIEPFLGGGALFFAQVAAARKEGHALPAIVSLGDVNPELMTTYSVVRSDPMGLYAVLSKLRERYDALGASANGSSEQEALYYAMRACDPATLSPLATAARMISLNRAGFNGVYRLNKSGKFNVPWGKKGKLAIPTPTWLETAASALAPVDLYVGSAFNLIALAGKDTLVYLDPPYAPVDPGTVSGFTGYVGPNTWGWIEHRQLIAMCTAAANRGARIIASNRAYPGVAAAWREEGFGVEEVAVRWNVGATAARRGDYPELIIDSEG